MARHDEWTPYRNTRPATPKDLLNWVEAFVGIKVATRAVCVGHGAPADAFAAKCLDRPPIMLELGSRGSGKSFLSALALHFTGRFHRGHQSRILGGSLDQSRQIYEALVHHVRDGEGLLDSDGDTIRRLLVKHASYLNGSEVSILAASSTSVRGPHVPTLYLDEVDEIEPDIRESAMGMCMAKGGLPASVCMTSTWHRPSGPMAGLIEQARSGAFPLHTYCTFEVLEHCPDSRSGVFLEHCPACPIVQWCHEDRQNDPRRLPKAKLSSGHYAIDSLIQKVHTTSRRVFEADYLCKGPKADGLWFPDFDEAIHVHERAEFDPNRAVHLAIDSGNRTGAVWFQLHGDRDSQLVSVFADYYSDGASAESDARAILAIGNQRCNGRRDKGSTDPAGRSRTSVGPSVLAEYERAGLRGLEPWPNRPVTDSLALLESFVADATGKPWLVIHPRCRHLIDALKTYRRGGKAPQWSDMPADPQHPAEDLVDALRGGLCHQFPDGRRKPFQGRRRSVGSIIH